MQGDTFPDRQEVVYTELVITIAFIGKWRTRSFQCLFPIINPNARKSLQQNTQKNSTRANPRSLQCLQTSCQAFQ